MLSPTADVASLSFYVGTSKRNDTIIVDDIGSDWFIAMRGAWPNESLLCVIVMQIDYDESSPTP